MSATNDGSFIDAVDTWHTLSGTSTPVGQNVKKQIFWDIQLCMISVQHVKMAANTQADVACLSVVSFAEVSDYLSTYPSSSVDTRLKNSSLRITITQRLGARICKPHICIYGDPVDSSGTRGLSCRMLAGRFSRHAAVNDLIKRSFVICSSTIKAKTIITSSK